ncbi:hypothetical protein [Microlunatus sp. Y2014]|uniref:hypothetical protein n=1 Tax=Microlunatus sp. Y2014 TaxID=3418488 RepID=UPI003DA725F0
MARVIDLGVAMTSVNTRYTAAGALPDGTPVIYAVSQGTPSSFNVVHAQDGSSLDSHVMTGPSSASGVAISPDGLFVYFGAAGGGHCHLYQYDVLAAELTLLATDPAGQTSTRSALVAPDGKVYCATSPDAKVYSWDPATGEVRDYGSMTDDGTYAWGLEYVDGTLWVGTGIGTARLFLVDAETGEKTELALPEYAHGATNLHMIARRGDLVVGVFTPKINGTNTIVRDLSADTWLGGDVLEVMGLNGEMTPMTEAGVCYYERYDGAAELCSFDPVTRTSTPTGWQDTPMGQDTTGFQHMGLLDIGSPAAPRIVVAGMRLNGRHWWFDPATGDYDDDVLGDIVGAPIAVHTLDVGPRGDVWTGAHLSSGVMGVINTRDDTLRQYVGPAQADAVTGLDGKLVVGTYPGAEIHIGDLDRPWDWGTNPASLFSLGRFSEYEQDRPRMLVRAGDQVAMATVPNYGTLGGALTLFGLDGEFTVHRNIVPDQSVVSVAHVDGLVVGGTSIDGGLSSTPTATEAEVFVWDLARQERVFHTVPAPGARSIGALCVVADRVWGLSDTGVVFELDPVGRTVTRTISGAPRTATTWGSSTYLAHRKQDGLFYAANGARMFILDPETEEIELYLDRKVGRIVVTPRGKVYFSAGTNVFRYIPPRRRG